VTVLIDTSAMREVARKELPSTKRVIICVRFSRGSIFIVRLIDGTKIDTFLERSSIMFILTNSFNIDYQYVTNSPQKCVAFF
jgi:hypothetical protein